MDNRRWNCFASAVRESQNDLNDEKAEALGRTRGWVF
jgi:hypothetical protein